MKKYVILGLILLIAAGGLIYSQLKTNAQSNEKMVLGYTTSEESSYQSLKEYHEYINTIAMDTYAFETDGNLSGEAPENQLKYAKQHDIDTYAVLSNFGKTDFDPDLAHAVMNDKEAKSKFIGHLVHLAAENDFTGINIDFEAIYPEDRDLYSNLIKDTAKALKEHNIQTMVSVPAKDIDDPADDWSWPYNYEEIGEYADYVQVMTYDENGSWSDSGSVASLDWMKRILTFATESINPDKVIMGVPSYGYDWNLSNPDQNKLIEWDEIYSTIESYDIEPITNEETASMHFNYTEEDQEHIVWFEDEDSLQEKSYLTNIYGIAGVSVYAMGHETESFWKAIDKGTK
ncbi:glycosylase [Terribacillus saccharophilus]|uniref:glycosyl hydrolase family 18 protein n=1 Tax=Terribacillus saccharophilus TaxID=361277 RepID=UPI000BA7782E|nr:glycosyl hydrolase family 18 protein [Terribacillus saccharophilus]PAF23157.1 glycosylase [Terribacillus saccharophilus]